MPTIYADQLNNHPIYADRAEKDASGNNIATTYATKSELAGFTELPSLTDNAGKVLAVNSGETGVEWVAQSGGGGGGVTQVQSDWTEDDTAAVSYIQNKPTEVNITFGSGLAVTTTGSTVNVAAEADTTKADKVSGATNGDLAALDSNGNLVDSGIAPSSLATTTDLAAKQNVLTAGTGIAITQSGGNTYISATNSGLPSITGNANKVLKVNASATDIEWAPESGASQVQANWNETDTNAASYIQNKPDLSGFADKVPTAAAGDLVSFDCYGNIADSGIAATDVAQYPSLANNAGKVLAVNSGETGVEWIAQSGGGGGSYTAGVGIDITSNVVSAKVGTGLTIADYSGTEQVVTHYARTPIDLSGSYRIENGIADLTTELLSQISSGSFTLYVEQAMSIPDSPNIYVYPTLMKVVPDTYNPSRLLLDSSLRVVFGTNSLPVSNLFIPVDTPLVFSSSSINSSRSTVGLSDIATSMQNGDTWALAIAVYSPGLGLMSYLVYDEPNTQPVTLAYSSETVQVTRTDAINVDVASLTTAGITDIQVVNSLPASPVSTVLYLIPET